MATQPILIRHDELERWPGKVKNDGGDLRVLDGEQHGLGTSVMESTVVPGSGPRRHRHPHAEIFVVHEGFGRFEVEDSSVDAGPGDMVIIPRNAWHGFANAGSESLRLIAIHENGRVVTEWEDGSRRG